MFVACPISELVCLIYLFYPQLLTYLLTRFAFRFGVDYDSLWIMIHPRLNVDRGYTRSTWASSFMIGQSTVITNQQGGGGRVFKHYTPFCSIACFTTAQACGLGCSFPSLHSLCH